MAEFQRKCSSHPCGAADVKVRALTGKGQGPENWHGDIWPDSDQAKYFVLNP